MDRLNKRPLRLRRSAARLQPAEQPQEFVRYLRAVDILRDLNEQELAAIHNIVPMKRRSAGTVFYRPDDQAERLFILKEGTVTLYRLTSDGHKLILGTAHGGSIFGEMALAGQSMEGCFAEAQDDALVCTITPANLERLLRDWPVVAWRLLALLGRRIQELEERLEQMAYRSVRLRLVRFLLAQADSAEAECELRGFSHEHIGEMIGATRQTVTAELRQLEHEGLLEIRRKRIRLRNVETLRPMLEPK